MKPLRSYPITNYPLPITHYPLPITNYQLPILYFFFLTIGIPNQKHK
ncbi:alpha/beta hydrolase [Fischerella thermalis BR2B]|nr:alpha/beta hydrolase [Fischerella thermalis BR2B]